MQPDALGMLTLERRRFVVRLAEAGVRALVVGGEAVRAAGHARPTKDLDIVIQRTREDIERVMQVAAEFGFQTPRSVAGLAHSTRFGSLHLRLAPPGQDTADYTHHVDVLFADTYLPDFDEAHTAGIPVAENAVVRFAGASDLIAMKQRAASHPRRSPQSAARDRADIEFLERVEEDVARIAANAPSDDESEET